MRIHELLETCVEYVAIDGVLGSDPYLVIEHLRTVEPSIDTAYFSHLYRLLVAHPSIQVVLTSHPLPSQDAPLEFGTAPLPADFDAETAAPGANMAEELYNQGVRGRQLAFQLAGQEYRTDKETMVEVRDAKRAKWGRNKDKADTGLDGSEESLLRILEGDDGGDGADKVSASDYIRLREKWGSRLRVRATDSEIYYRLTGSHTKNPKLTPIVFHTLQLAARARGKGITAIELGPAVGTSQGSLHYFMKVLCQAGLTAKVPAVTHGNVTNLLLFHRFVEQNENYRAIMKLPPLGTLEQPASASDLAQTSAPEQHAMEEDGEVDGDDDAITKADENQLNFGPITERQLMSGHIVRERLIQLLDLPTLKNHLLKKINLLPLVGWKGNTLQRHYRAVRRQVDALIHDNVIEAIEVGERKTSCIRLTKYNPDFVPIDRVADETGEGEVFQAIQDDELLAAHAEPHSYRGQLSAISVVEWQVNKLVADSGIAGATIADLRDRLDDFFKRIIEFHMVRCDHAYVPPELKALELTSHMEQHGRERHLRAFSVSAFREVMLEQGQTIDESKFPALPSEAGQWMPIASRPLYDQLAQVEQILDAYASGDERALEKLRRGITTALRTKAPAPRASNAGRKSTKTAAASTGQMTPIDGSDSEDAKPIKVKLPSERYDVTSQARGRPRKYLHVVDPSGKVNRAIIGEVYSQPELTPIWVYFKAANRLVEAPPGYLGLGPPPPIPEADIKKGKSPSWFDKFDKHSKKKGQLLRRRAEEAETGGKRKRKATDGSSSEKKATKAKRSKGPAPAEVQGDQEIIDVDALDAPGTSTAEAQPVQGDASTAAASATEPIVVDDPVEAEPADPPCEQLAETLHHVPESFTIGNGIDWSLPPSMRNATASPDAEVGTTNAEPAETRTIPPPGEAAQHPGPSKRVPSKRGRQKKASTADGQNGDGRSLPVSREASAEPAQPKRRGRKRKTATPAVETTVPEAPSTPVNAEPNSPTAPTPILSNAAVRAAQAVVTDPNAPAAAGTGERPADATAMQVDPEVAPGSEPKVTRASRKRKAPSPGPPAAPVPAEPSATIIQLPPALEPSAAQTPARIPWQRKKPSEFFDIKLAAYALPSPDLPRPDAADIPVEDHVPLFSSRTKKRKSMPLGASPGAAGPSTVSRSPSLAQIATSTPIDMTLDTPPATPRLPPLIQQVSARTVNSVQQPLTPAHRNGGAVHTDSPILTFFENAQPSEGGFDLPEEFRRLKESPDTAMRKAALPPVTVEDDPLSVDEQQFVEQPKKPARRGRGKAAAAKAAKQPEPATPSAPESVPLPPDSSSGGTFGVFQLSSTAPGQALPTRPLPAPATPAVPKGTPAQTTQPAAVPATPAARRIKESTPLVEVTSSNARQVDTPGTESRAPPRLELGHIRRCNEAMETLKEHGGCLADHRLRGEHYEWTKRNAGTDRQFAPVVPARMDRGTFKRVTNSLLTDGRIREKITGVPTVTGRVLKTTVFYLPSIDDAVLDSYIRGLSATLSLAVTPKRTPRTKISNQEFTEVRLPHQTSVKSKLGLKSTPVGAANPVNVSPEDRRAALMQEPAVVSSLYGYIGGRAARVAAFHRAVLRSILESTDTDTVISKSPQVITLGTIFNEFTVPEWFSCITHPIYDEDLEKYIHDPASRRVKLRDLPSRFRPRNGFGGHRTKQKVWSLLSILTQLRVVQPLAITDEEKDALVTCENSSSGSRLMLAATDNHADSIYFRVYEYVPIYHIAASHMSFLGVLPINQAEQLDFFWQTVRICSSVSNINNLPRLERVQPPPDRCAPLTETSIAGVDGKNILRARNRWNTSQRILDVQRVALDNAVSPPNGESMLETDEAIKRFAWEYVLPRHIVVQEVNKRKEQRAAKTDRRAVRAALQVEAEQVAERRRKTDESLQAKIAEMRADAQRRWQVRVKDAAERNGIEHKQDLEDYLGRYAIDVSSRYRGHLSDPMLDEGCRLFVRSRDIASGAIQIQPRTMIRHAPLAKKTRKDKKAPKPTPVRDPSIPQTRRRKQWSNEDDELMLDCEAIIRARARNKPGHPGRHATALQVFNDISYVAVGNRLKKILLLPGKHAYLDRLTQAWFDLWMDHRGEKDLPDEDPDSMTEFDLMAHVRYLREHVTKQTVRNSAMTGAVVAREKKAPNMPKELDSLLAAHDWTYDELPTFSFDGAYGHFGGDALRAGELNSAILSVDRHGEVKEEADDPDDARSQGKIKALLKMIISTPQIFYYDKAAEQLLRQCPGKAVDTAANAMVADKAIKRDKGHTDSRQFAFTPAYITALDGPYAADFYEKAAEVKPKFDAVDDETYDISLFINTGEMANLLDMVSAGTVEYDLDIKDVPCIKYPLSSYQSRKMTDTHMEFDLKVRRVAPAQAREDAPLPDHKNARPPTPWATEAIDVDTSLVKQVIDFVGHAGAAGLTKDDIVSQFELSNDKLTGLLAHIASSKPAAVFWAGYDTARLVHVSLFSEWAIKTIPAVRNEFGTVVNIDRNYSQWVTPRKWINIYGERDEGEWVKAQRACTSLVLSRPGISERLLREKLSVVYDRLEIGEMLQYCLESTLLRRAMASGGRCAVPVEAMDLEEELEVAWWPSTAVLA